MGADTSIEWANHTFSPWWGCTRVSAACRFCYAEDLANRYGHNVWGANAPRRALGDDTWKQPTRWNHQAEQLGVRYRVFSGSMCDIYEDVDTPLVDSHGTVLAGRTLAGERERLFDLIEATPHLDWLLLTKRPENVLAMSRTSWRASWPINAWTGSTIEDLDARVRLLYLLAIPSPIHFVSMEPLLADVDITTWLHDSTCVITTEDVCTCSDPRERRIDWVITGGESGPKARLSHPDWFRHLRDQVTASGAAFFMKQWGEWIPYEPDAQAPFWNSQHGDFVDGHALPADLSQGDPVAGWWAPGIDIDAGDCIWRRVGKKNAGRLLDGVEHNDIPTSPALDRQETR